jgi:enoyl-CoA hydratase/carnithine racemase
MDEDHILYRVTDGVAVMRWRNVPKPSIAAVQGKCIAGGLLLAWPCDLIVAAENAEFSDPVVSSASAASSITGIPGSSAPARPRRSCSPGAR